LVCDLPEIFGVRDVTYNCALPERKLHFFRVDDWGKVPIWQVGIT